MSIGLRSGHRARGLPLRLTTPYDDQIGAGYATAWEKVQA